MFCQKCGNPLNDGAVFCPKCGEKIASIQASSDDTETVGKQERDSKPSHRKIITIACVLVLIAIAVVFSVVKHTGITQPKWVSENEGKGAGSPSDVARALVSAMLDPDPTDMHIYWDAYYDEIGASFDTSMYHYMDLFEDKKTLIYREGITYDVKEEYEQDEMTYANISVHLPREGLFGGESITSNGWYLEVRCHKNKTPEGDKWFWSGTYSQNNSGYANDETGLAVGN